MVVVKFRKKFVVKNFEYKKWFPGHMHKGLRQINARMRQADCLIEVHDARIPFTGRNPTFASFMSVRPSILVLNKADLADRSYFGWVEERLRSEGVGRIFFTNCREQGDPGACRELLREVRACVGGSERFLRGESEDINLLVVGIPNTGKSSLINMFRAANINKKKAVNVGSLPGVTLAVSNKIKIEESPPMYVFDSPGLIAPFIGSVENGLKLSLCNNIKQGSIGEVTIVDYLLYTLNKTRNFRYVSHFGLEAPTDHVSSFLEHVAIREGLIQRDMNGEDRPNHYLAAIRVLNSLSRGSLGTLFLDPP